jgi:pantetheine-phosphate adenylyltransferase
MDKVAVFPGSFDPFTIGHHNLVTKALPLFDRIIIAVGKNTTKTPVFEESKRINALKGLYQKESRIEIVTFSGLTVELCKAHKASFIIRGLRNGTDFDYEKAIAHMNKSMVAEIETIFLLTEPAYENISSTIVREIYKSGGDISAYLPKGYSL